MKKRLLSALLVLVMVLSLVPFGAFAADATEPEETTVATETTEATDTTEATAVTETTEATEATEAAAQTTAPSEPTAVEKVQELIDALPETVTAENRAEVEAQLTAIDEAKLPLTDDERDVLDFGKYNAAIAAINAMDGQPGAQKPDDTVYGDQYKITLDPNGGELSAGHDGIWCDDDGIDGDLPIPTRDGYDFLGWYTAKDGGTKITKDTVSSAHLTLYAHWIDGSNVTSEEELRACVEAGISNIKLGNDITLSSMLHISGKTLTLDLNGKKLSSSASITVWVMKNGNLTVTDTGSGGTIENTDTDAMGGYCVKVSGSAFTLENGTLSGKWGVYMDELNPSFQMRGGSIVATGTGVWAKGNFVFSGGTISGGNYSITIKNAGTSTLQGGRIESGSVKCDAGYVYFLDTALSNNVRLETGRERFLVTFQNSDGTCYAATAARFSQITAPTTPTASTGTVFAGWYTDAGDKWDFSQKVTQDMTLTAKFDPITYTITYKPGADDATGTIANGTKKPGEDFTLTPSVYTREGFLQVGWEDEGGNIYYGGQTYSTDANLNLTAVWEKEVEYTIPFTKTVKQNGSTKPGEATFNLYICGVEDIPDISGTIDCNGKVTTKGTGNFTGTLTISGSEKLVWAMLWGGIYVQEWDSEMDKWTYDNRVYFLRLEEVEGGDQLRAYTATAKTVDKATVYSHGSTPVKMTFTNTYGTAAKADTSNPKTGDTIYIAAATCLLSAMALIAILPGKKRM